MTKNTFKFVSMLLAASFCVNFISCNDDDDEKKEDGTHNGFAYVDLGLPSGLKWAISNVGAANPWDCGDYFAWGETVPKDIYDLSTYLNGNITESKEFGTDKDLLLDVVDISGSEYDAARANMKGKWRIPNGAEFRELMNNCYWEWTDDYNGKGVAGCIVYKVKDATDKEKMKCADGYVYGRNDYGKIISKDEKYRSALAASYSLADIHIFLPVTGFREGKDELEKQGGNYWSSSLSFNILFLDCVYYLTFNDVAVGVYDDYGYRFVGHSVRAVYSE
ncbi:MAG: hypothetical protein E7076_07760 [Bacteroidales bacterium]|nr:hypothetical protein [Bacteroidales bacterium]